MNVRRGRTPLQPRAESPRRATTESGQIVSTICDAESSKEERKGSDSRGTAKEDGTQLTDEVVNKIHLAFALPHEGGWRPWTG